LSLIDYVCNALYKMSTYMQNYSY